MKGESVPNDTMNPVFLFEVIHTTVVPALTQKNWLFLAFGISGLTLDELPALVISTVQGAEADPQVLAAVHRIAGSGSSHTYLLFFCAWAAVKVRSTTQDNTSTALKEVNRCIFIKHLVRNRSRKPSNRFAR
jgi:hypothetical protein